MLFEEIHNCKMQKTLFCISEDNKDHRRIVHNTALNVNDT